MVWGGDSEDVQVGMPGEEFVPRGVAVVAGGTRAGPIVERLCRPHCARAGPRGDGGECAGGMHGANRLGGNSLSDLLVFGWLAGKGVAEYIGGLGGVPQIDANAVDAARQSAIASLNRESGPNPYLLHEELQDIMHANCNIVREAAGIEKAIEQLGELKKKIAVVKAHGSSQYNPGWHEALSLRSMIVVAEAVSRAGLLREESRGAHTRLDFEGEQEKWGKINIVIRKGDGGEMEVRTEDRGAPPEALAAIAFAKLDELEGGIHA